MIRLKSLHRAGSVSLAAIVAVALLTTSASQAQQASLTGGRCGGARCRGQDRHEERCSRSSATTGRILSSPAMMLPMPRCGSVSFPPMTRHSIKAEGNKKATLILGADDFPFPIPW